MSSIQSVLMSNTPLPLSKAHQDNPFKAAAPTPDSLKAAKDFESVFSSMMLKEMRQSLDPGTLFGGDTSDIYGGLFDQFMGQHMADSGGIGMAKMIREALDRATQGTGGQASSVTAAQ